MRFASSLLACLLAGCASAAADNHVSERAALAAIPLVAQATDLEVHFIDVGTADCIWIKTGDDGVDGNGEFEGLNIIIDGGDAPNFGRVDGYKHASAYLTEDDRLPKGSTIDWLILTHAHSDHCGGLDNFLDDYEVLNILDPGFDRTNEDGVPDRTRPTTVYGRFFARAAAEVVGGVKSNFLWGVPDDLELDWGSELDIEILHSSKEEIDNDLNNTSIVIRLGYSDPVRPVSFLFTGDAEEAVEKALADALGDELWTTVLKAGHHGSKSSCTTEWLEKVRPQHVVITSGNQEFSGTLLPSSLTLGRIEQVSNALGLGTQVWRTDRDDKVPTLIPVGEEAGDDTVVARTNGATLEIGYANEASSTPGLIPTRCQAITLAGTQCKRSRPQGQAFCWQHD